jgi:integrase
VPLQATTRAALVRYAKRRDDLCPSRCSYFFVAPQGGKLYYPHVVRMFCRLSRQTGLRGPSAHAGPRLHDFRHSFAVRTLLSWYRSGQNVELLFPVLSTYLGHTSVHNTYWYLSACPELMGHAARMLEKRWGITS